MVKAVKQPRPPAKELKLFTVVYMERTKYYGSPLTYFAHEKAASIEEVLHKYDTTTWFIFPGWQEPLMGAMKKKGLNEQRRSSKTGSKAN